MMMRLKFSKTGAMKYIGHLDVMRYFQKALRRASIPVKFSAGFHPHMLMSFAAPLSVGVESTAEYFDLELSEDMEPKELVNRLNAEMAEGFAVLGACCVRGERAAKAMSLVAAADYKVKLAGLADDACKRLQEGIGDFLARETVLVTKEGKKGTREVDIRPLIYCLRPEEDGIFMSLASGSRGNCKPETVISALAEPLQIPVGRTDLRILRLEVYARKDEEGKLLLPLDKLGEDDD